MKAPARRITCLAASLSVAAFLGACRREAGRPGASRGGTLTILYPVDERSWAFYVPSQFLVFLPLVRRNVQGELEGWLARSWEHSPNYRTWTIHLRPDVRWHDGVPVTAADVKFSLDLLAHPDVGGEAPGAYAVGVLDDTTLEVTLRKGASGFWMDYDVTYPKHLLAGLDPKDFYEWDFWTHPVGNGPYRYVRHVPKTMMEFEANPDYFRGRPAVERVVLKFGEPVITELLSGNVEAIPWVQELDLLKLQGDPRFQMYYTVKPEHIRAVLWNHRRPPFDDPRVRRALTLAIDRRALAQALNLPANTPIFDVIFTREQFYRGELPEPLPYDPVAAGRLLEDAGWRDTDGDGLRDHRGRPFRFEALVQPDQSFTRAAVFIQSQLRAVGVRMEVVTLEAQVLAGRVRTGEFEASIWVVNNDVEGEFSHGGFFGKGSLIGYRNARVAALLERAAATADPGERDRVYRELAPIFLDDVPVTFLYPLVRTTVAHRRVRGLSSPWRDDPLWYAEELWLEEEP